MKHGEAMRKQSRAFLESINEHAHLRWFVLLGTTLVVALLLFPALWTSTPRYQIGDVAEKDIKSAKNFLMEDKAATQIKREEAARSVPTVYDFDDALAANVAERIAAAFEHVRSLPPAPNGGEIGAGPDGPKVQTQTLSRHDWIWKEKETFEEILGSKVSSEAYKILEQDNFSESTALQIARLLVSVWQNGIVESKELLRQHQHNGIIVRRLSSREERRASNLEQFRSREEARTELANTARNFHDRSCTIWTNITKTQNTSTIAYNCYHVTLVSIFVSSFFIILYRQTWLGDSWCIPYCKIIKSTHRCLSDAHNLSFIKRMKNHSIFSRLLSLLLEFFSREFLFRHYLKPLHRLLDGIDFRLACFARSRSD